MLFFPGGVLVLGVGAVSPFGLSVLGVPSGLSIVICSVMIHRRAEEHVAWGFAILGFSGLGFISSVFLAGGFGSGSMIGATIAGLSVLGPVLATLGGSMGTGWRPKATSA